MKHINENLTALRRMNRNCGQAAAFSGRPGVSQEDKRRKPRAQLKAQLRKEYF